MSHRNPLPIILVVNDDADAQKHMMAQLSRTGAMRAEGASGGMEALGFIETHAPDLILCDINTSGLNGFQLCQVLKSPEFAKFNHFPVILTSTVYPDIVARQVARDVGAYAYLWQPYEEADLIRLIESALAPASDPEFDPRLLMCKGTIALFDNDTENLVSLSEALQADCWRVLTADSAEKGLRLLRDESVQIVLTDDHLPDMTWQDILERLRALHPEPLVILMTGQERKGSILDRILAGADDWISKPSTPSEVLAACHRAYRKFSFLRIHEQFRDTIDRLKEMGDYLNHLIQHSEEGIFSCDIVGHVRIWNRGAERMYGYTAEEICGHIVDDFLDPPGFKRKAPDVAQILQERGAFSEKEIWRRQKDGTVFPVRATYSPIRGPQGTMIGFSVVEHDISTAKRLEEELIKSERMRAITQLAVTTHDRVNTPLGVILGYAQFLQRKIEALSPEDVGALQTIEKQVQKIKDILNQLERISEPVVKEYSIKGVEMLDLAQSK
jgi:PAS domain S-box-containing protein